MKKSKFWPRIHRLIQNRATTKIATGRFKIWVLKMSIEIIENELY